MMKGTTTIRDHHQLDRRAMIPQKPDRETASALKWRDLYGMSALSFREQGLVREWDKTINPHQHTEH